MKSVFFILGLILLVMSCIPCSDSKVTMGQRYVTITASTDHQQHSQDSDLCTPFCSCSCCAAPMFSPAAAKSMEPKLPVYSAKYPFYNIVFDAEGYYSIWQPPQIG